MYKLLKKMCDNNLSPTDKLTLYCKHPIRDSSLKVALQILGQKFYKNMEKIIFILQKPFDFHQ